MKIYIFLNKTYISLKIIYFISGAKLNYTESIITNDSNHKIHIIGNDH